MVYRRLGNMEWVEFGKFLKFAKMKEDKNFKVIPMTGIYIFQDGEKIAMISQLVSLINDFLRAGDVVYEVENPNRRSISLYEKKKKTEEVYKSLFLDFIETDVYKKIKKKEDRKKKEEKEKRSKKRERYKKRKLIRIDKLIRCPKLSNKTKDKLRTVKGEYNI